ncbi:uncharacterized protein LOC110760341 [Prunus avium]|uniref:Uncharacterized protein LOC110760341 n=1 Tax=Prunus avium TaxID=42229 RepID=A0A6P5SN18_PRUAV|nr:uncharacterized protein LOC110760341 [Prunus avium]
MESEYLVHLGNRDFFHVKTGRCFDTAQYLCITTFQIVVGEGERYMIKTINSTVHSVDLECAEYFNLVFCFMPECGDYEPIEDKSVTSMNQPKQEETILENGKERNQAWNRCEAARIKIREEDGRLDARHRERVYFGRTGISLL